MSPLKLNGLTENEIIAGALKGDKSCQKDIFDTYAPRMMTICRRYSRHIMEAEDVLQDSFIKIFQYLHQFKSEGSFDA